MYCNSRFVDHCFDVGFQINTDRFLADTLLNMTDLDYYACRGQIPVWTQNPSLYNTSALQTSRPVPMQMRSEPSRWCRTSTQQLPQQQPKILYNLLMQPESRNEIGNGCRTMSNNHLMPCDASHQFSSSSSGDFLVPVGRPRSRSMGAAGWRMSDSVPGPASTSSRTPSRDSLASYDGSIASDESAVRWGSGSGGGRAEQLLEDARSKLMTLSTKSDGSPIHYETDIDTRSMSQPGSPHTPVQAFRKYSEGSQLRSRFQHLRTGYRSAVHSSGGTDHPVDLSCKRKKFECTPGLPYARRATISHHVTSNASLDEGLGDDSSSERSILKSILTGRVRSNSMSVCGNRHTTGDVGDPGSRLNARQRVTLAKKNLLPVKARITDLLNKSIEFARQHQCYNSLPLADQRSLLVNAAPRLLLLEMARSNTQFAVTPVHGSGSQLAEEGETAAAAGKDGGFSAGRDTQSSSSSQDSEMPTQQFVESVQNFVRKCQSFGISNEEYFYMRMIALFQLGNSYFFLFLYHRSTAVILFVSLKFYSCFAVYFVMVRLTQTAMSGYQTVCVLSCNVGLSFIVY